MLRDNIPYLERLFIQELNSEGSVDISGIQFEKDHILYELDRSAYLDVFEDWKNNRREQNIEEAKRIISLFDNRNRFLKLKELFKNNRVLPFVGAGLSFPTGFPLWKDFLINTQKETSSDREKFNQLLDDYKFEEAAQLLEEHSPSHLQEQLDNNFGRPVNIDEIEGCICRLPELFGNTSIITTNYDNLLKMIYEKENLYFECYLNGIHSNNFHKILSEGKRALLKLHGDYTVSSERILTQSDYDRHYNENNKIQSCIESISMYSLLFLGCSLGEDRYLLELKNLVSKKGSDNLPRHYAFLSHPENEEDRIQKKEDLQKANIFPIWYDGDHDESIEALFELLLEK